MDTAKTGRGQLFARAWFANSKKPDNRAGYSTSWLFDAVVIVGCLMMAVLNYTA